MGLLGTLLALVSLGFHYRLLELVLCLTIAGTDTLALGFLGTVYVGLAKISIPSSGSPAEILWFDFSPLETMEDGSTFFGELYVS